MKRLLVADLFCGAGGSSTGCRLALRGLGLEMQLVCVNHWPVAIETHRKNHPDARHYCEDVEKVRPSDVVPEGRLDLLMASPECIFHSRARGGKPINDQSRMSAWAIHRWCSELRVRALIIENVPEFMEWGPLDPRTKKPIKSLRGTTFRAWLLGLRKLGLKTEYRILNAADHGDATTRKRFFLLARSDRKPIRWPEPTHSRGGIDGLLPWRGADQVIDFELEGQSIFHRRKRLATNTLERIYAGIVRFNWPEPYRIALRAFIDGKPLPDFVASPDELPEPLVARTAMHKSNALCVRSAREPLATITTDGGLALVEPFSFPMNQARGRARGFREIHEPLGTITATGTDLGLVEPFSQASGGAPRATSEPVPTIPTDGAHALITAYHGRGGSRSARDPLGTITTRSVRLIQAGRTKIDIRLRMLHWKELAGAHSFTNEEADYAFVGNQTEVVAQVGNSVPVRLAAALAGSLMSVDA